MHPLKVQNGHQGVPKWPIGSGKGSSPKLFGAPFNKDENMFFDSSSFSMSNKDNGEGKLEKEEEEKRK